MDEHGRARVLAAAACLAVFVAITVLVATGTLDRVDLTVRDVGDDHYSSALATAGRYLTDVVSPPVDTVVLLVGAVAISLRHRSWLPVRLAVAVTLATAAVVLSLKYGVHRGPPLHPVPRSGRSFPSGHTAAAVAFLGTLALLHAYRRRALARRLVMLVAALSVLVMAALVYDDYHWLTDVVASAAYATAVLLLVSVRLTW